jgi:transcriptional regulator with XRE-family HTH domain
MISGIQMSANFGSIIKRLREERFVRPSEIEKISRAIATETGNSRFYISHGSLDNIENSKTIPGIFKIFSLAVCFRLSYEELLAVFGVNAGIVEQYAAALHTQGTIVEHGSLVEPTSPFLLKFDSRKDNRVTDVLPGRPEEWGLIPPALVKRLEPARFVYVHVGIEDDTMGDIIPAGSLLEIDKEQNVIERRHWTTIRQRPIYLVWHERGYSCSWCHQNGNVLTLIPHPLSVRTIMRFKTPREATVIGRVVHGWIAFQPESERELPQTEGKP